MEQDDVISLDSQEDSSSQEGAPALKRQKTLPTHEDNHTEVGGNEEPGHDEDDDEEALPLTFHTKEDLIRKLKGIKHLPGGELVLRFFKSFQTVVCRRRRFPS